MCIRDSSDAGDVFGSLRHICREESIHNRMIQIGMKRLIIFWRQGAGGRHDYQLMSGISFVIRRVYMWKCILFKTAPLIERLSVDWNIIRGRIDFQNYGFLLFPQPFQGPLAISSVSHLWIDVYKRQSLGYRSAGLLYAWQRRKWDAGSLSGDKGVCRRRVSQNRAGCHRCGRIWPVYWML